MRKRYLTGGFADSSPSSDVSTPLVETRARGAVVTLTALPPFWKLALDATDKSPNTITFYLDSVKRLEAYLAGEGLLLEPQAK